MSPTILTCPDMNPNMSSGWGSAHTILTTGFPLFVIKTGSLEAWTSSMTFKQRALNAIADICFIRFSTTSPDFNTYRVREAGIASRMSSIRPKDCSLQRQLLTILIASWAYRPHSPSQERSELRRDDSRRTAPRGIPAAHEALEALGAVPCREAMGNGSRGLQSGRNRVGTFSARYGAVARVPLGGGRHRRDLRPASAGLFRARALEWPRSYPEGAPVWVDGA
jgi:hypothetical protein